MENQELNFRGRPGRGRPRRSGWRGAGPINRVNGADWHDEFQHFARDDFNRGNRRSRPNRRKGGRWNSRGRGKQTHHGERAETGNIFASYSQRASLVEEEQEEDKEEVEEDNIENSQQNKFHSNFDTGIRRNSRRGYRGNAFGQTRNYEVAARLERTLPVDQNAVLHYLVKCHDGSCLVSDLQQNKGLFGQEATPSEIVQSLQHSRNIKVLVSEGNIQNSVVKIILKPLRLCFNHKPPKPCTHERCRHIHLCKDFVMDSCSVKHCCCNHNVESAHNMGIMETCGANIFNSDEKLTLIRCANLEVCREFNSDGGCSSSDSCFKLHMCSAYVLNRCLLPDEMCSEGHDLLNERNRKVLQLYEMDRQSRETVFRMILALPRPVVRTVEQKKPVNEDSSDKEQNMHLELSNEAIEGSDAGSHELEEVITIRREGLIKFSDFCQRKFGHLSASDGRETRNMCDVFDEHECNLKDTCTDRHKCRTPFLWRVKIGGQWMNLEQNTDIERAFCDPDNDDFWDVETIPNTAVRIKFNEMKSNVGPIQRLSTPSYVTNRGKVDSTVWQWYWYDKGWNEYELDDEPPYQDILELKYQRDSNLICCFEHGRHMYELEFAQMKQTNLRTKVIRKVKRRPLFNDTVAWATTAINIYDYHCDDDKLPAGWMPMDTESKDGTELVPLHSHDATYRNIKQKFFKTLEEEKFKIRRIYRLQNLELWNHYQNKKAAIDLHMESESEVRVYHGTAKEDVTRWICGVGFDQRMQGVNGTRYGKGSYFARTAKYSHCFTKPTSRNLRYMFYAQVVLGRVAQGSSEHLRPPPIDPDNPKKGLYDSCTDNLQKPSMFIIYDNNQSYPTYLIEYQDIVPPDAMQKIGLNAIPSQMVSALSASRRPAALQTHLGSTLARPTPQVVTNPVTQTLVQTRPVPQAVGLTRPVPQTVGVNRPIPQTVGLTNPVSQTVGLANPVPQTSFNLPTSSAQVFNLPPPSQFADDNSPSASPVNSPPSSPTPASRKSFVNISSSSASAVQPPVSTAAAAAAAAGRRGCLVM